MENVVIVDVTDLANGIADDLLDVNHGADRLLTDFRDRNFATDDDDIAFHEGLASHAALGINGQAGVENGVRDGVGYFVRMAFAAGF